MSQASSPPRIAICGLWVVAVLVTAQLVLWSRDFFHDDAFITLRYAQNWLAGSGIGWNPGERVEGYTNFLQLVLVTGLGSLGLDLVAATRVIGLASWAGVAVLVLRRMQGWPGSLAAVATLSAAPLVTWAFGGLEAPVLTLLIAVGTFALWDALQSDGPATGRLVTSGAALGLACLARLDAGLLVAVGSVFVLGSKRGVRGTVAFGIPIATLLLPWLAWKWSYYGAVLPNTWWVKGTSPSAWRLADGLEYALEFVVKPPFPLLWLAAGAVRAAMTRGLTRAEAFGLTAVGLQLGWVVYVGGDQMPASRLLVPLLPLAAWIGLSLWRPDLERLGARGAAVVTAVVAAGIALQLVWPTTAGPQRNAAAFMGAAVGRHIAEHFPPGALVALNTAGATPYHAPDLRYLDMLGLNDAHIARREVGETRARRQRLPGHAKGDGAYVLGREPDYVILGPSYGVTVDDPWFLSDLEIAENPSFLQRYRERVEEIDVSREPRFADYEQTRSGSFAFTFYERR